MNFKETGWDGVEWIHLGLGCGRQAGSCVHGNEFSDSEKKARTFMPSEQLIEFLTLNIPRGSSEDPRR
jgi:hypothetical protein